MFIRTITYPISYLPLARGDSKVFIFQEAVYDIMYVIFIIAGYKLYGLLGVGAAIAITYFIEWIVVSIIAFLKYKFVFSKELIRCFLLQLPIFLLMVIVTQTANDGTTYWIIGILVTVLSAVLSFYLLSKRLSLVKHLMARVKRIMK